MKESFKIRTQRALLAAAYLRVVYAMLQNRDMARETEHAGDDIDVVTFTDGLGRVIQTKKDAAIPDAGYGSSNTTINDKMVVSGRVYYDAGGRVVAQYYPSTEDKGSNTAFNDVNDDNEGINPTTYTYDAFDRPTFITFPDGTSQSLSYLWSSSFADGRFETEVTDALTNKKRTYKDSKQQIKKVEEEIVPDLESRRRTKQSSLISIRVKSSERAPSKTL
jgi:YD repeat-containing protein